MTIVSTGMHTPSHLVDLHLCEPMLCIQGEVPQNLRHACGASQRLIHGFSGLCLNAAQCPSSTVFDGSCELLDALQIHVPASYLSSCFRMWKVHCPSERLCSPHSASRNNPATEALRMPNSWTCFRSRADIRSRISRGWSVPRGYLYLIQQGPVFKLSQTVRGWQAYIW